MESKLKSIEIVKFKSITNRVQLADVSIINNVVFAPFDCELSDDLVEAIEYAFGKEVRMCGDADVIITVKQEATAEQKFQRCYIGTDSSDTYYEYEMNEPQCIGRAEYLAALGLWQKQTICINRNSTIKELAASLNVTPLLERMCKSLEHSDEMEQARNDADVAMGCTAWLTAYIKTLQNGERSWQAFRTKSNQLEEILRKSKALEKTERAVATNEQTNGLMYLDATAAVNYDNIIHSLFLALEQHSIGYVDNMHNDLQNCFNAAIVPRIKTDKKLDFHIEPIESVEFTGKKWEDAVIRTRQRENRMETEELTERISVECGSVRACHHHTQLKVLQSRMSNSLDDYAFWLESVRPINHWTDYEIPRRFYNSNFSDDPISAASGSVGLGIFSQKIMARDEQHANQILDDFEESKGTQETKIRISSIDLILQVDSVQADEICAPENSDRRIALSETDVEQIRNILSKYVLCDDERDAAPLADEYPRKTFIVGSSTLNHLRMMECGHSDAFKSTIKIYCFANCIEFCKYAVVELPQFYRLVTCLAPIDRGEHEAKLAAGSLQWHQTELHEQFVKRITSKWNAWKQFDTKKKIELLEVESYSTLFRTRSIHLKLTINPFGIESQAFINLKEMLRAQKKELEEMTGRKRGKIQELKERTDVVENLRTRKTELFDQITRKLFDNVNTIYENLLPNASLNFSEGNENPPHLGANRYESRHSWLCSLRDEYSNTSRYRAAMAIMLCVNEVTEAPGLIVSDFRTFFSDIDLFEFLRYIFGWTKQRLIVLSKTHVVAAGADRFFWLYRTHLNECDVFDPNARLA